MDVVEDDDVSVGDGAAAVVNDVAEDDAILGRSNLHVGLDAENQRRDYKNLMQGQPKTWQPDLSTFQTSNWNAGAESCEFDRN